MEKIRVLIIDDEELARLRLRKLLQNEPDIEICGECASADEAAQFLQRHSVDLAFLDIQMKGMDGFDLLRQLGGDAPFIIFVTAYDQYALDAFEANALDYLLKPFSDERFKVALQRARDRIHEYQISTYSDRLLSLLQDVRRMPEERPPVPAAATYAGRLVLKSGSHLIFVDAEQIDWVEAEGVYVRLHTNKKSHLLRESLNNVEARLNAQQFVRIHRSTIVNVDRIKEIVPHPNGGSVVILQDGTQLRMSRSYRDKVSATLG